jgi:hypothetical protein
MKEKIESFGKDGSQCVMESITNGWKGLFPLKGKGNNTANTQILSSVQEQQHEDNF